MIRLHFHGQSCWTVDDGTHKLIVDPFLRDNPLADVKPEEVTGIAAVLLTHGHFDHVADAVEIAKANDATVISNYEIAAWAEGQGCKAHPMHIGGGFAFPFGHVKWTVAHHGSTGPGGEALGNPMGVVLTLGDKKIYHAGDTALFSDMRLIAEMSGPLDVAILPIGDNFTMGIDDAVKATEFLAAGVHIPMHYDTFPYIEVDATEFVSKVKDAGRNAVIVEPGGTYEV